MLELHEINLRAEDKQKIHKLCETKGDQVKYKDALALIQLNRDVDARPSESMWTLQIPSKTRQNKSIDDTRSQVSIASSMVSIDPIVRRKAEEIFAESQPNQTLEVIDENEGLTETKLKTLPVDEVTPQKIIKPISTLSKYSKS